MSKRKRKSELHHFVPQWYLRQFVPTGSKRLKCFDFRKGEFEDRKPVNVMAINDYYKQESDRVEEAYALEDFFARVIEPKGKAACLRLLTMANDIRPEETAVLLAMIIMQRLRVPRQARLWKEYYEASLHNLHDAEFVAAYRRGEIVLTDAYRFAAMNATFARAMSLLQRMDWSVICAPSGKSFVTTDNPVIFFNPRILPPFEAGPAFAGTSVFFPLSPDKMLMMYHPECKRVHPLFEPPPATGDRGISVDFWPDPLDEDGVRTWNRLLVQMCDHTVVGRNEGDLREALEGRELRNKEQS